MDENKPPADFAMLRAVEILAGIFERSRNQEVRLPQPTDKPIILFNENIPLAVGTTTQSDIEKALGSGYDFPAKGYSTYAFAGPKRDRRFLSVFYRAGILISAEFYLPKTTNPPNLAPRVLGDYRLVPGEIVLTSPTTTLDERFGSIGAGGPAVTYDATYIARYPGGVAYACANRGIIERLALYLDDRSAV